MASELTVTLLRFGFLALLWVFVFVILAAQRRDLGVGEGVRWRALPGRGRRRGAGAAREAESAGTASGAVRQQMPPAPQRPGRLVIVDGPEAGKVAVLGDDSVLLGRAPDCTLTLQDDYSSGHHARLFPQGSRWFLEDLGSTNGTFVGGQRLTRALPVEPGEPFTVGRTVMELRA